MSTPLCWEICIIPPKCTRKERRHDSYSRCSFVVVAAMSWRWCVFPNMVRGRKISITRLRFLTNQNALDSWPIRAHLAFQSDELCKNRDISERLGKNIRYVENNVLTLNFILKKLHQIHKIMLFVAFSFDLSTKAAFVCKIAFIPVMATLRYLVLKKHFISPPMFKAVVLLIKIFV